MKSIFSLILVFLMTLPNCGMVFAGNMDQIMKSGDTMEVSEMKSGGMTLSQDEDIQNPYYSCCSDIAHNSILTRDTSTTNTIKDVVSVTHVVILTFRGDSPPEKKKSVSILYRQNAPPDPGEYISLIGSSVKNLN